MPTKKARINIAVPDEIHQILLKLAKRDEMPVATKVLDLLKDALDLEEDRILGTIAEIRMKIQTKCTRMKTYGRNFPSNVQRGCS